MAFSDSIEQLAFGKSLPEMSSCIGLYLSATVAYIAETRFAGGKPVVDHLVRVPIPQVAKQETRVTGVLNTDILADADRIAGLLKQAMGQSKWRAEHVVVTLSHNFGILRYFIMPAVDPRFWKMAVPAEAKKYIPIQMDDLLSDFQVDPLAPGPDKRARQGALYGVTQQKNLDNLKVTLQKMGLTLVGLELSPCSVSRLWGHIEGNTGSPYAHVHFDGGDVHIILNERGVPIFVREILMGTEARVADRRKLDLSGCLDFSKKQLSAARPAKVYVSGATPEMAQWQEAFSQESGVPVQVVDTSKVLGVKAAEWGGFAAIGAASRHLAPSRLTLDLAGAGRADETDKRTVMALFSVSGILAGLLLAAGIAQHGLAVWRGQELSRLNMRGATLGAFKGKSANDIKNTIEEMQRRADSIGVLAMRGDMKFTKVLETVSDVMPESAWVTGMQYANPLDALVVERQARRNLTLSGHVMGASEAAEQDIAIQLKETLARQEEFHKAYPAIEVSVQASHPSDSSGAANPLSEGALEQRTTFSIACKAGKS